MTKNQACQFFDIMLGHWPAGSVFRYFARRPFDGRVHGQAILTPSELVRVTKWADDNGYNSYVQVNPTLKCTGVRCSGVDVTHWSWFLFDIDPISTPDDPFLRREAAHDALMEAERILRGYLGIDRLKRTIIDSGRGVQGWYPLEPVDLSGTETLRCAPLPRQWNDEDLIESTVEFPLRTAVPRAMSYWLEFFRARMLLVGQGECAVDTSVSDLPRVMRIPFTVNAKTGQIGELMSYDSGVNVGLAHKLLHYAPYDLWKPKDPILALMNTNETTPWDKFLNFMSVGGRVYLTEGAAEGGRHKAAASALLSLHELGCGKEQARSALIWGGQLCTPVLPPREIHPMIERHYRRDNGPS
jgi:hypothetical protein